MNASYPHPYDQRELDKALEAATLGLFVQGNGARRPTAFISSLFCSLDIQWDHHGAITETNCTDGVGMYINPKSFMALSPEARISELAHETWHVAFEHPLRGQGLDQERANNAMDHSINLMLENYGYEIPDDWVKDRKYSGMSFEEIYPMMPTGQSNPRGGDVKFNHDETRQLSDQIMKNVIRAATLSQMFDPPGSMPGDLREKINAILYPKIPWETQLRKYFNEKSEANRDWSRPSTRYLPLGMYLPSNGSENALEHIVWAMDASGSMAMEQLQVLNSEVKHVKDMFNPKKMTLLSFDTMIRRKWEFDENQPFEDLDMEGGGGTDLRDVWKFARKVRPNLMVVMTDLYVDIPPQPKGVEILWVIFDNPDTEVPYGTAIHVDTSTYSQA